ncbi:MAG: L-lysine 6-transaminase [Candidatus Kapaibacteriota bacterium]|jgi:L-lysine 6-transaminase
MAASSYQPRFAVNPTEIFDKLRSHMLVDGFDLAVDVDRSHGSWFVDARSGKEYLDFFSCIASMPIGMNHPKMTGPAFLNYIGRAALNKLSNSDVYSSAMATFVNTFFSLAVPTHFRYAFFIEGGALAVENAIKTAMDWKVRRNFAKGYLREHGTRVLHFEGAFHGRSGYTMSLTNTDPTKVAYFPKFDWPRVSTPYLTFPLTEESVAATIRAEEHTVRQIEQAFREDPDGICAIILEPIQGEGGDRHFRPEFLATLRRLADEHEALLIFDEVQTGVGMTGRWWAHEGLGVQPDIMSFGKKMQVCGILVGPRVDDVPENVFHTPSRINSTWGGALIDMVRITRYLEIIDEDGLLANAAQMGQRIDDGMHHIASQAEGGMVTNVRGMGLFRAFDLPSTAMRNHFIRHAYDEGVIMVGSGHRSVRFRPPLNISESEVDTGLERIARTLHAVASASTAA